MLEIDLLGSRDAEGTGGPTGETPPIGRPGFWRRHPVLKWKTKLSLTRLSARPAVARPSSEDSEGARETFVSNPRRRTAPAERLPLSTAPIRNRSISPPSGRRQAARLSRQPQRAAAARRGRRAHGLAFGPSTRGEADRTCPYPAPRPIPRVYTGRPEARTMARTGRRSAGSRAWRWPCFSPGRVTRHRRRTDGRLPRRTKARPGRQPRRPSFAPDLTTKVDAETGVRISEGAFAVYEDRAAASGRLIHLPVVILHSRSATRNPTRCSSSAGGPGADATHRCGGT